ncbi:MAG TPA: alpha/beta hydrolase [Terriglobales bacterium]|nr:alpha/beta hydrolase [Terriglobales bacterium]
MRLIFLACVIGLIPVIALLYPVYLRDRRKAILRLRAASQIIETPAGHLEYATTGEGTPLIVLHGMGGGYDQGLLIGSLVDTGRYHIIAPTRAGYRRTPLTSSPTFEEQADAVATVLDRLNIQKAAILGLSGGGFASIQFAIRHPDRCTALILLSAHGPATLDFLPNRRLLWVFEGIVLADFLLWLAIKLPPKNLLRLEGCNPARLNDPLKLQFTQEFMSETFPAVDWKDGTRNDIEQLFALEGKPDWPLEQIKAPTLILHGKRDRIVRFKSAQLHAQRIPNTKFIPFEDGTHFSFVTHRSEVSHAIEEFLN